MKIEVELEYVDELKKRIEELEQLNDKYKEALMSLNEHELIYKAKNLSYKLLNNYLKKIFKELGFDEVEEVKYRLDTNDNNLDKVWYNRDDVEVNLNAEMSKKLTTAFISIGVIPPSDIKKTINRLTLD